MRGVSLVETLVSLAILLVVVGALFALANPAQSAFAVQEELVDMQQRLRVAVHAISATLVMAGAGGEGRFAPVRAAGAGKTPEPPETFFDDRVSVLSIPPSAGTTVRAATDGSGTIQVEPQAGCPGADPLCGFQDGQLAMVFDDTGAYEVFTILGRVSAPPAIQHPGSLAKSYQPGAAVALVNVVSYRLRIDAGVTQLATADGWKSEVPVIDHVARLHFEYLGDPQAGEGSSLVPYGAGRLTDGPWLPDATFPNRFDADWLRVRLVRVTIGLSPARLFVQAPAAARDISFDVSPRNMNLR